MGKFKDGVNIAGTRVFNTAATPFRMWGAVGNAVGNVLRQWQSSAKNTAEVGKQTIDALVDNFLNFSKVEGKRYQRLTKWTINLASAVTRRPAMIAGAGILSALNQWMRKPFTKLAPGKLFKDIGNAFRIFSKKKGFDFQTYDTHETKGDTWINQIKEKRIWFFGKWWSSEKKEAKTEKPVEKAKEADVPSPQKPQQQTNVVPMPAVAPKSIQKTIDTPTKNPHTESEKFEKAIKEKDDAFVDKELAERGYAPWGSLRESNKSEMTIKKSDEDKPKNIDEWKKKQKAEASAKDQTEIEAKKRKNLSKEDKAIHKKEFEKLLENDVSEKGVLARAKKHNKGANLEQILRTLDKENITFATFIDDEILAKKTSEKAAA